MFFCFITLIDIIVKDFHDFYVDFLEDSLKKKTLGKLITDSDITFSIILSEYKDKTPEFILSLDQYNEYKNSLNKDIQQSEQCLAFNNYFQEFHVQYPNDFKRAYDCCVIKFKLKGNKIGPSISIFKSYIELFHEKCLDETKGDELIMCGNVDVIDKRFKDNKITEEKKWDFGKFPYGRDYRYGWQINGSTDLSLECPVPGCKFGGFAKIYDNYCPALKERLITNNGHHDAVSNPNWNWVEWNYGEKKQRKRSMKVAIMTHFARMQQIDQFPSLLNKSDGYGFSLGSQFNHDLTYVPMNWRRQMIITIKKYRSEMGTKL